MKSLVLASALLVTAPGSPPTADEVFADIVSELRRSAISYGYACREVGLPMEACIASLEKTIKEHAIDR